MKNTNLTRGSGSIETGMKGKVKVIKVLKILTLFN